MPSPKKSSAANSSSPTTMYLFLALLTAALGPFQFGYHLAELNAPQSVITCEKKSKKPKIPGSKLSQCIPMTIDQFALVSSIVTLGGLLGALAAGPYSSKHGRLRTMRIITLLFIVGPIAESLSPSIPVLAIGRFISGLGAGASLVVVPIYISETCPPDKRGLFGALTQILCNLGIVVTQGLGLFLSHDNMWRVILATAGFIAVVQLFGLALVPESPKWLAEHGDPRKAEAILKRLRGGLVDIGEETKGWHVDRNPRDIEEEESLISPPSSTPSNKAKATPTSTVSIFGALFSSQYRPAVIAVVAVMVAQQFTGINSVIMYSVHILTPLLPTSAGPLTVAVSAINLIMTSACAPLPDKIGRKTCILLSTTGMGISSIFLAVGISKSIHVLAAVAMLFFVAAFAVGLGPVPFILANELVGPEAVGATQSWALAANWIATFIVSQFFPMLNKALGENGKVYYVFTAMAVVLGAFIAYWVPETRGKRDPDEVWGRATGRTSRRGSRGGGSRSE